MPRRFGPDDGDLIEKDGQLWLEVLPGYDFDDCAEFIIRKAIMRKRAVRMTFQGVEVEAQPYTLFPEIERGWRQKLELKLLAEQEQENTR